MRLATLAMLATLVAARSLEPAEIVVDASCSLVDAITAANTDSAAGGCSAGSGADEVVLTQDVLLTESVDGENGLPVFTTPITIRGNGFTVSRASTAPDFRLIRIDDLTDTVMMDFEDVVLRNGSLPSGDGGGLFLGTRAEVVLTNVTVSGNSADLGGGVYQSYNADLSIYHSRVVGNSAEEGGGIFKSGGLLFVENSTIAGNSAVLGGGISNNDGPYSGVAIVESSTISGNTADLAGGILSSNSYAYMIVTNSTISGNADISLVGGVHSSGQYNFLTLTNTTVTANSTVSGGAGGVSFYSDWYSFRSENAIVSGNFGGDCSITGPHYEFGQSFDGDGSCGSTWNPMTGLDTELAFNGGPSKTHALLAGSSAIDATMDCPSAIESDQRGFLRDDGACDSGSFEFGAGVLSLIGECPGSMTVVATQSETEALFSVFQGPNQGSSQVPSGTCTGTDLEITAPTLLGSIQTDASGNGSAMFDFVAADCGEFLQGVEEIECTPSNVEPIDGCDRLTLSRTGEGAVPTASPANSVGCSAREYLPGEVVSLGAAPDPSWVVGGWNGTDDDGSTGDTNALTMPSGEHQASVDYVRICRSLTVTVTGSGAEPIPQPDNSDGCGFHEYLPGTQVTLTGAIPDPQWAIQSWSGTDDDNSTDDSNIVTIPDADHSAGVNYFRVCSRLFSEHTGSGADPLVTPSSSAGCLDGAYLEGELIDLLASPDTGQEVGSWTGTDDDASTSSSNTLTMPGFDHTILVNYIATCYPLTLDHTGSGADPLAIPIAGGTDWERQNFALNFDGADTVRAADIDGDADLDVIASADIDDEIAWWENVAGDATTWTRRLVTDGFDGATELATADIDGDGDQDILGGAAFADLVAWWENTVGDGTDWVGHVVGSLDLPTSVAAADLDGDLDLDILAAGGFADAIVWWENLGGDGLTWTERTVADVLNGARSAVAVDMDGDQDLDVVAAALGDDEISWWENTLGDGTSWSVHPVALSLDSAAAVAVVDVDGDQDLDIFAGAHGDEPVTWWENTSGDGLNWTRHPIGNQFDDPTAIGAADLDRDGDADVLATDGDGDEIAWWENESGDGSQWTKRVVAESVNRPESVFAVDLDGDSEIDILAAASVEDRVSWWRNFYSGTCPAGSFRFEDRLDLVAAPDPGWEVSGWTGTEDDSSAALTNTAAMPAGPQVVSVVYSELDPADVSVSVSGTCPGSVDVSVTTVGSDEGVLLYVGAGAGTSEIATGGCAGTELAIDAARFWRSVRTDTNGEATFTLTAPTALCGRALQAVDRNCTTSNVVDFP